ncbi:MULTISPECIES: hypothetical protein [Ruegeria]|uniref:Uncharacterized protein n=1 Tax=Ruegeria atlantica TaxID=81569 RepID=A0ABX1WEW0_9RHOB|nr:MULTISPECIES: hypothetical protein [Ruegeria]NOD31849.1 hypothetical protein [Ruegeria atlantica]
MGGIGSGRHWHWGAKNTTSDYRSIDARRWAREGFLTPGRRFSWQWSIEGKKVASIDVLAEHGCVRLIYRSRDHGDEWESLDYPVRLLSQPCHYGGHRYWFACPARGCGRRVAKLYGGRIFACRHCHQLAYPSQRETTFQRNQRRADKIRERLGWLNDPDLMEGTKPKGMHWRTYYRLVAELEHWEEMSNKSLLRYLGRLAVNLKAT